jgi:hypothetical protein
MYLHPVMESVSCFASLSLHSNECYCPNGILRLLLPRSVETAAGPYSTWKHSCGMETKVGKYGVDRAIPSSIDSIQIRIRRLYQNFDHC